MKEKRLSIKNVRELGGMGLGDVLTDPDLDWTEDFSHENGNYECICSKCKRRFIGHKRRVVCKKCAIENQKKKTGFIFNS